MKKIFTQIKIIAVGIIFAIGLSYVSAAWQDPAGSPTDLSPDRDAYIPVHTEVGYQVKNGGLSVNGFSAQSDAYFDQDVYFVGMVQGGGVTDTSSTLFFGGAAAIVDTLVNGFYKSEGDITVTTLATGGSERALCADMNGNIVFCQ